MKKRKIAVIGGGPAGFMAAVNAAENSDCKIDVFEKSSPLKTVLYTGNGRCNLSNNITDYRELASNYPRGEKFLYSAFSQFGVPETLQWLRDRGVETYVQPDNRIFPKTDRAATIRSLFLDQAAKFGVNIIKTEVLDVEKKDDGFIVKTGSGSFCYDAVILAAGGGKGSELSCGLEHNITELKPALTAMLVPGKWTYDLAGVSIKNARVQAVFNNKKVSDITGDFVFTHTGLAGPAVFNTSSYTAYLDYSGQNPLVLRINFLPAMNEDSLDKDLQMELTGSAVKSILNIVKKYIPRSLAAKLLADKGIDPDKKAAVLTAKERKAIVKMLLETEIKVTSPAKEGEIVTAGGVKLKQVNAKTMESKLVPNLYFCGEVLDIDGLTGGFNLQMCWSTGYLAGINVVQL